MSPTPGRPRPRPPLPSRRAAGLVALVSGAAFFAGLLLLRPAPFGFRVLWLLLSGGMAALALNALLRARH
jgi:hypothetical protein